MAMGSLPSLLLLLLLLRVGPAVSTTQRPLRILAAPLLPTSPTMDMLSVVTELHARGHKVLVVGSSAHMQFFKQAAARHSSNTSAETLQYLEVDLAAAAAKAHPHGRLHMQPRRVTHNRFAVPRFPRSLTAGLELQLVIQDEVAGPCALLLEDATVLKAMQDFRPDAVTAIGTPVPDTATDSCGCLLSHALGVPMIDIDCGLTFWSGPPSVPQFGSGLRPSDLHTARGAVQNLVTWLLKQAGMPVLMGLKPTPWSAARDQLGLPRASSNCPLVDAAMRLGGHTVKKCDVILNAIMSGWILEHPRPLKSFQVMLGPGNPRTPHAIQQPQVAEFVVGASSGLLLVGFGTSHQFNSWLSAADYAELSAAFAALAPVRVLWHIRTEAMPKGVDVDQLPLGSNTLLVPQVDYNDVLGHSNTRLFVSHCGVHSLWEAAYHGVPIVGVPFMFEQAEAGRRFAATGAGLMLQQAPAFRTGPAAHVHYTREHVTRVIQEVLHNDSYRRSAQRLALVLQTQARRLQPYAAAADEVELAVSTHLLRLIRVQLGGQQALQKTQGAVPQLSKGASAGADQTEL